MSSSSEEASTSDLKFDGTANGLFFSQTEQTEIIFKNCIDMFKHRGYDVSQIDLSNSAVTERINDFGNVLFDDLFRANLDGLSSQGYLKINVPGVGLNTDSFRSTLKDFYTDIQKRVREHKSNSSSALPDFYQIAIVEDHTQAKVTYGKLLTAINAHALELFKSRFGIDYSEGLDETELRNKRLAQRFTKAMDDYAEEIFDATNEIELTGKVEADNYDNESKLSKRDHKETELRKFVVKSIKTKPKDDDSSSSKKKKNTRIGLGAVKDILHPPDDQICFIQIFSHGQMMVDLFGYEFAPDMRILSAEETDVLLDDYQQDKTDLPIIQLDKDPAAARLGLLQGQVIEETIRSKNVGYRITHRVAK